MNEEQGEHLIGLLADINSKLDVMLSMGFINQAHSRSLGKRAYLYSEALDREHHAVIDRLIDKHGIPFPAGYRRGWYDEDERNVADG